MTYFPSGSSGDDAAIRWCYRCTHYLPIGRGCCPVWYAHIEFNYDQLNDDERGRALRWVLSRLWPERSGCAMFHPSKKETPS